MAKLGKLISEPVSSSTLVTVLNLECGLYAQCGLYLVAGHGPDGLLSQS